MDFIRVTLIEKWDKKSKISQLRQIPEHLLPVSAIKSIHPKHTREGVYIIDIIEHFKPTDEQFEIAVTGIFIFLIDNGGDSKLLVFGAVETKYLLKYFVVDLNCGFCNKRKCCK